MARGLHDVIAKHPEAMLWSICNTLVQAPYRNIDNGIFQQPAVELWKKNAFKILLDMTAQLWKFRPMFVEKERFAGGKNISHVLPFVSVMAVYCLLIQMSEISQRCLLLVSGKLIHNFWEWQREDTCMAVTPFWTATLAANDKWEWKSLLQKAFLSTQWQAGSDSCWSPHSPVPTLHSVLNDSVLSRSSFPKDSGGYNLTKTWGKLQSIEFPASLDPSNQFLFITPFCLLP